MGAIAQQNRVSKTRKRKRRSHHALKNPALIACPECGEMMRSHVVCPHCGYYDKKNK
jgi:large subunit ribosomal protein L32